jgi:hypothetical protein
MVSVFGAFIAVILSLARHAKMHVFKTLCSVLPVTTVPLFLTVCAPIHQEQDQDCYADVNGNQRTFTHVKPNPVT